MSCYVGARACFTAFEIRLKANEDLADLI